MIKIYLPFLVRIVLIIFVSMTYAYYEGEAGKRYKIVILPFRNNTQMNFGEMIPDVLRSTVTQTGYFKAIDRDKIYETAITVIPTDLIYIDNTERNKSGGFTANQIDLIARLDTKRVQRFSKKLKADYAVKASVSQIGDSLRIDAEILDIKANKMLGFVSVEGSPDELLTKVLKELSNEITIFCRRLNAYDDALYIIGMYNQGQYTFDVSEKKLKELLSITEDAVGIHAVLMVFYLSGTDNTGNILMEDKVIEEGEKIIYILDQNYDERVLEIFSSSGLDLFDELAKIYTKKGNNEKAIEIYQKAINLYPMNIAGHYKELGMLYLKDGSEDKAMHAFERSLDANKGDFKLRLILATMLEKRNQSDKARKHLEECLKYARNVDDVMAVNKKINEFNK